MMAVSFNSVVSITTNHWSRKTSAAASLSTTHFFLRPRIKARRHHHSRLSVANDDMVTAKKVISDENSALTDQLESDPTQSPDVPNGNAQSQETQVKKTPLTVREKLRAARVLSRYGAPKPKANRAKLGSSVLDALKESDKGKRSGLPEAPTNLLDDSKRGMPKAGLTFDLPVGRDLLIIAFSFVFISTVMFGTTYLVWKLGAIHFNEN